MKQIIEYIYESLKINKNTKVSKSDELINKKYKELFDKYKDQIDNTKYFDECIKLYDFKEGNKYITLKVSSVGWVRPSILDINVIEFKKIEFKDRVIKLNYDLLYSNDPDDELGKTSISINKKYKRSNHDLIFYYLDSSMDSPKVIFVNPVYNDIILDELDTIGYINGNRFFKKDYSDNLEDYEDNNEHLDWQWQPGNKIDINKIRNLI